MPGVENEEEMWRNDGCTGMSVSCCFSQPVGQSRRCRDDPPRGRKGRFALEHVWPSFCRMNPADQASLLSHAPQPIVIFALL